MLSTLKNIPWPVYFNQWTQSAPHGWHKHSTGRFERNTGMIISEDPFYNYKLAKSNNTGFLTSQYHPDIKHLLK